jgi:hypothetical protein
MNGQSSGFLSGAASGAAIGFEVYGPIGAAVGGVIGGVAGLVTGGSADAQHQSQMDIARFNAITQYSTNMQNAATQFMISSYNMKVEQLMAKINANRSLAVADYNVQVIQDTLEYNNNLLDEELRLLWEQYDLDSNLLEDARAVERGKIEAVQAASGVVMGQDSAADVIIDQKTQEALDAFILRHGADVEASKILNAKATNEWKGEMQIRQTQWQGELAAYDAYAGAYARSSAQKVANFSNLMASSISGQNYLTSTEYSLANQNLAYSQANTASAVNGMFSAGSRYIRGYAPDTSSTSLLADSNSPDFQMYLSHNELI